MEALKKIGQIETAQAVAEERISRMQSDIEGLTRAIHELTRQIQEQTILLSEAKGGWRVILLIGGGIASTIAAVAYAVNILMGKP